MILSTANLEKTIDPDMQAHLIGVTQSGLPEEREHALAALLWVLLNATPNNVAKFSRLVRHYGMMADSRIGRDGWLNSITAKGGTAPQIAQSDDYTPPAEPNALALAREFVFRNCLRLDPAILSEMVMKHFSDESKGTNVNQFSATDNEPILLSINLSGLPRPLDSARRRKLETDAQSDDPKAVRAALVWLNVIDKMTTTDGVRRVAEVLANVFKALPVDDKLLATDWKFGQSGGAVKTYRAVDRDLINGMNRLIGIACKNLTLDELRSLAVDDTDQPAEQFSTGGGEPVFQVPRNAAERVLFERARLRAAAKG